MGADGNIKIYDINKFHVKYGQPLTNKLVDLLLGSVTYAHMFKNTSVLTVYTGDNLYVSSMKDRLEREFGLASRYIDPLDSYDKQAITDSGLSMEQIKEMLVYLNQERFIDDWEVWT